MMLAEIVVLLFREQSAETLFHCIAESHRQDREAREARLLRLHEAEEAAKRLALQKRRSRHTRFGGTFAVAKLADATGGYSLKTDSFLHTPTASTDTNEAGKSHRARRRIVDTEAAGQSHRSPLAIRLVLHQHACSFIETAFNSLLPALEREIEHFGDLAGASDEVLHYDRMNFLRLLRLFLEFNRLQLQATPSAEDSADAFIAVRPGRCRKPS